MNDQEKIDALCAYLEDKSKHEKQLALMRAVNFPLGYRDPLQTKIILLDNILDYIEGSKKTIHGLFKKAFPREKFPTYNPKANDYSALSSTLWAYFEGCPRRKELFKETQTQEETFQNLLTEMGIIKADKIVDIPIDDKERDDFLTNYAITMLSTIQEEQAEEKKRRPSFKPCRSFFGYISTSSLYPKITDEHERRKKADAVTKQLKNIFSDTQGLTMLFKDFKKYVSIKNPLKSTLKGTLQHQRELDERSSVSLEQYEVMYKQRRMNDPKLSPQRFFKEASEPINGAEQMDMDSRLIDELDKIFSSKQ